MKTPFFEYSESDGGVVDVDVDVDVDDDDDDKNDRIPGIKNDSTLTRSIKRSEQGRLGHFIASDCLCWCVFVWLIVVLFF